MFGIARYPEYISKVVKVAMSGRDGTKSSRGAAAERPAIADTKRDRTNIIIINY